VKSGSVVCYARLRPDPQESERGTAIRAFLKAWRGGIGLAAPGCAFARF